MKLVTFELSGTSTLVPGVLTENESGGINLPKANEILEGPSKSNHFSSLLDRNAYPFFKKTGLSGM